MKPVKTEEELEQQEDVYQKTNEKYLKSIEMSGKLTLTLFCAKCIYSSLDKEVFTLPMILMTGTSVSFSILKLTHLINNHTQYDKSRRLTHKLKNRLLDML